MAFMIPAVQVASVITILSLPPFKDWVTVPLFGSVGDAAGQGAANGLFSAIRGVFVQLGNINFSRIEKLNYSSCELIGVRYGLGSTELGNCIKDLDEEYSIKLAISDMNNKHSLFSIPEGTRDLFTIASDTYGGLASRANLLNNWATRNFGTNSWYVGEITSNKMKTFEQMSPEQQALLGVITLAGLAGIIGITYGVYCCQKSSKKTEAVAATVIAPPKPLEKKPSTVAVESPKETDKTKEEDKKPAETESAAPTPASSPSSSSDSAPSSPETDDDDDGTVLA